MSIQKTGQILTEQQFKTSPFSNLMSYDDYLSAALKLGSTFTVAKAMNLINAEKTTEKINESVQGWYLEKEAAKVVAEEEYYAALAQYEAMKSGKDKATSELNYATKIYGEESTQYNEALQKYKTSSKSLFGSDVNLSIARDKYSFANRAAHNAFFTSRLS